MFKTICRLRGLAFLALMLVCLGRMSLSPALAQKGQFTVVIDPGHGGKDAGAVGYGYKEKDVVLAVAKKLGKRIKNDHPKVRVLYTRERDVFVGLQARADFANRHKASLFISIHANSAGKNSSVRGTETFVLGLSKQSNNLSVAMRENKAMLLEDNYKTIYKGFDPTNAESYIMFDVMQEAYLARSIDMANFVEKQYRANGRSSRGVRQEGLWVLSQSAMPSILTEIGFISNKAEAQYMGSETGQNEIAAALSKAFTKFYSGRDAEGREQGNAQEDTAEGYESISQGEQRQSERVNRNNSGKQKQESKKSSAKARYKVQFMTSKEPIDPKDSQFKRLKQTVSRQRLGSSYIYTIGNSRSLSEAQALQKSIRKHYPDSFVVEYDGTKRIGRVR